MEEIGLRGNDYAAGQLKSAANVAIGIINFSQSFLDPRGVQLKSYEPSSQVETASMHIADVVGLVVILTEGRGPSNVITAESKKTTAVSAEVEFCEDVDFDAWTFCKRVHCGT